MILIGCKWGVAALLFVIMFHVTDQMNIAFCSAADQYAGETDF